MENNVNNNVGNTNPGVINNNVSNTTNNVNGVVGSNVTPSVVTPTNVTPMVQNINPNVVNTQPVNNTEQKSYKKFYIWMGIIMGFVLIIAGILLYFLLNGSIENRNRMTCTKTTQEEGYDYTIRKFYTFDNKKMVRVYYTYTFDYHNEITDDFYNTEFDSIININNNIGSSKYGLSTNIQKKDNSVIINAYEPNYYNEFYDDLKNTNTKDGYTCE